MKIDKGGLINDFIEPNRKQYVIPVYQRNYEWTEEQCKKLFEDIINAHVTDKYHFTGSVVFAPLDTDKKIESFVIIDGQQRLTTLYLLLKALIDCAQTEKERDILLSTVFNTDKFKQYGIDDSSKLKLKPIKSDNKQLLLIMEDKFEEADKNSGIYKNYDLFKTMISKYLVENPEKSIEHIYDGLEHLTCATIKLEAEDNAQEIFDRINSTGLPLSLADKIRNFVLMTDVNQEELYENYWLKSEVLVGYKNLTTFFLDYLNIKVDGFTREVEAYDVFVKLFKREEYTNESMLKEILHYTEFYNTFMYGNKKYSNGINKYLSSLRKLNQTTVYLFLYKIFDDYHSGSYPNFDEAELEKILRFLLVYTVRRTVCEVGSNSLRGLYKTLYTRVFNKPENKNNYYDSIISFFMQLTSRDVLIGDADFSAGLKYNNLYKKNAVCKYILTELENNGKELLITDNLTIEHIMPQNKNMSDEWKTMLGDNWEEVKEKYLHTLGNLTLTGYNSELGDKPFVEKKELLSDVHTKVVYLYKDVKECDVWNEDTITTRADNLIIDILDMFKIEEPEILVSYKEPGYAEYTCDNPDDATFKTPNYYVLEGEKVLVSSFAQMLRSVVEHLYEMDNTIIKNMALSKEQPVSWSQSIMFSYDEKDVYGEYMIKDTDIYESVGFSAYHTICIIKALLDKYDIDEFVYSAKENKSDKEEQ